MSSLNLTTLRTRVQALLTDAGTIAPNTQIDQGARLALEEYNKAALDPRTWIQPNAVIGTFTPTANKREQDITALTGVYDVNEVWFPYTAATPEDPPNVTDFRFYWNGTTPMLYLDGLTVPDGVLIARLFYDKLHTLDGLDGASASTFQAADDNLLCLGAAAYALVARGTELNETAANMAVSTPNYAALANILFEQFRAGLAPRFVVVSRPFQGYSRRGGYYDPNILGYR